MKCIFLHGLGQTASSWARTVQAMPDDFDAYCPELSDWLGEEPPRYGALYRALEAYCEAFSEPLCLCGLSLGGVLTLQYVIEHPEKVASFVLIGTQYTMPKRLLQLQNLVFRLMPDAAFQKMGFSKNGFIQLSRSMMDLDFGQELSGIQRRGLIVCGEKDGVNRSVSLQMQERIPQAQLVILPQAGHEANADNPKALGECISVFLQQLN